MIIAFLPQLRVLISHYGDELTLDWDFNNKPVRIPFYRGMEGHIIIDGIVAGKAVRMLVDTGAQGCIVELALGLNLCKVGTASIMAPVTGSNELPGNVVEIPVLEIGAITLHNLVGLQDPAKTRYQHEFDFVLEQVSSADLKP